MFLTTFQCDCERYFVFIVLNFIKICFVAEYMVYPEDVPYAPEKKMCILLLAVVFCTLSVRSNWFVVLLK